MSLEVLNRMLRKIRSLVSSYDERFFAWLEGKSTTGSKPAGKSLAGSETRTDKSSRSFYSSSNKMEIPDPWD